MKMLFKNEDRSFKFFLLDLNDVERAEITRLITENGGEICAKRNPPVIIFGNSNTCLDGDPVFHINYIRECVKHNKLLDLINFKIGAQGYYGCLMSMFVHGEKMCSFVNDTSSCCSSEQFDPIARSNRHIKAEQNYTQRNPLTKQKTRSVMQRTVPELSPEAQSLQLKSSTDSELVPDGLLPDLEPELGASPPNIRPEPAASQPNLQLELAATPSNSQFLPDNTQLSISPALPETLTDIASGAGDIEIALEVPEPVIFEELSACNEETPPIENTTDLYDGSTSMFSDEIEITEMKLDPVKNEFSEELSPLPEKQPKACDVLLASIKREDDTSLQARLQWLQTDEKSGFTGEEEKRVSANVETDDEKSLEVRLDQLQASSQKSPDRVKSPIFTSKKPGKNATAKATVVEIQPVAGGSRTTLSPTILRDESNRVVKVRVGKTTKIVRSLNEHRFTSSDSDDANSNDHARVKFVDLDSISRSSKSDGKKNTLIKHKKGLNPLREKKVSEDGDKKNVLNNDKGNRIRQSTLAIKPSSKHQAAYSCSSTSSGPIDKGRRAVSSTKVIDDIVISDSDSDEEPLGSSSVRKATGPKIPDSDEEPLEPSSARKTTGPKIPDSDEEPSEPSSARKATGPKIPDSNKKPLNRSSWLRRVTGPKIPTKKTTGGKVPGQPAKRRNFPPSRNFLPWEQRKMLKYLIDKNAISLARGNNVWRAMVDDGILTHRTPYSLNNHFRRSILPNIAQYPIKPENLKEFQKLL